ncbi:MAG TPA: glucose-6-phosphate isomerase, partial [Pseudonocardiaceae bacterium]|nr:glucose-6-phosphate isomerase [Pseudonocardiaceae bacterium]
MSVTEVSVRVLDEKLAEEARTIAGQLAADQVASKLAAHDPTLWGPDAESEASIRLSWTTLPETSRPLVGEIEALTAQLRGEGVDRVVLAGMGGSSLAPEVITKTAGAPLVVLDTTDPGQVADALAGDLERTVLVVSSKSGSTVETDSHRRIFVDAFQRAGIDAKSRIVVVTDPGSPLAKLSQDEGYRATFVADPHVGGRYSALTAFGLVPAGLAGVDINGLLNDAADAAERLVEDLDTNPGLLLGAALGTRHSTGAEKVVLADSGSGIKGFPDWAEQLIAESTGKNGTGLLPVAVESPDAPGFADARSDATPVTIGPATGAAMISTEGPLGGQMLLWEYAVAVAGRLLGINPFDQPDVEAAKVAARSLLDKPAGGDEDQPRVSQGSRTLEYKIYASGDWLPRDSATWLPDDHKSSMVQAVRALIAAAPEFGYVSVQAYLDRLNDTSAELLRAAIARRSGLQTTFGWGPRFL